MKRLGLAARPRDQRGITLLVSMIFLVVLTLIVLSAIRVTTINTKLAGNMQIAREADALAQTAIEGVVSNKDFTANPVASTTTIDINGSGLAGSTYSVYMPAPKCIAKKAIKLSELDPTNTSDQGCYASGAAQNTGIVGAGTNGNSMCFNSNWEINATATPPSSTASAVTVHQGVAMRVSTADAC